MSFPSRLLFKTVITCPLAQGIAIDGEFSDWVDVPPLPDLCTLDGDSPYAEVKLACNPDGVYISTSTTRDEAIFVNRKRPHAGDSLQIWLDTRGGLSGHRATRFCHHFIILPIGGPGRPDPMGWQQPIRRAHDQPPMADPDDIEIAVRRTETEYSLELFLPTRILVGYDAEPGQVMGFTYLITDRIRRRQTYSAGEEFPYVFDPSTWGLLKLPD